jgi:hypothetical protein
MVYFTEKRRNKPAAHFSAKTGTDVELYMLYLRRLFENINKMKLKFVCNTADCHCAAADPRKGDKRLILPLLTVRRGGGEVNLLF